jgi:hypothetical protein
VQDVLNGVALLAAGNAPETRAGSDIKMRAAGRLLPVHLVGLGEAGLWCLLARPLARGVARTVVDAAQFPCDDDAAWIESLYLPHIRRAGDLRTAAVLIAPGALIIHNAAPSFPSKFYRQVYAAALATDALHIQPQPADVDTILGWLNARVDTG